METAAPAKRKKRNAVMVLAVIALAALAAAGYYFTAGTNILGGSVPGDIVDSLDGVYVYYNGGVGQTHGRRLSDDGYNIGIKYQCVEFVKRYYLEHFNHRMPDSYGHAKDFFEPRLKDGKHNERRNLQQFHNGGGCRPQYGDLVVFGPTAYNPYGHVAIVSDVTDGSVEIIQQNPGPRGKSRVSLELANDNGKWRIGNERILGWLRMYGQY